MSWISWCCFALFGGLFLSSFSRNADLLSPGRLFALVWSLAIGLAELKLSRLQAEWSIESWIQVLIGPASFLTGIFIVYILNLSSRFLTIDAVRERSRSIAIDEKRLFEALLILFGLFVAGYLVIYLVRGDIPLFSSRPQEARKQFTMFVFGLFLHHVVVIGFFAVLYHVVVRGKKGRKWILKALALISVVLYGITLQRFQIMMVGVTSLTFLYYTTRRVRFVTAVPLLVAVIAFFYWVSSSRAGELYTYYLYLSSEMRFSPEYAALTEPYMYVVMNLENFARSIDRLNHFSYGFYTFDFVTAISGLKHWISLYFSLDDTPYLVSGYNTYGAFWTYYRDFGVMGIFIIPLLGGIVIGSLYSSIRRFPGLPSLAAYAVAVFVILLSFFINQTGFLWFVYTIFLMYFVFRLIMVPEATGPRPLVS